MRPYIALIAALFGPTNALAEGQACPSAFRDVHRLVLVTATTMATQNATLQLFERASSQDKWRRIDSAEPAVIGISGMAWGYGFREFAHKGEPIKTEGDKRTPAGMYRIGRSFGFAASLRPDYLRLKPETVCVDDPSSTAYNTVTSRRLIGRNVHGEDMRHIDLYRRGLVVDYSTDRATRAGSCIFIHVWRTANSGTSGCVAVPEKRIVALQDFSQAGAIIAVLPRNALDRFGDCLPNDAAGIIQ
jgi:L,D-peptidoglycan transpeptidase YkuD (ErfK/YbiS/YcfS/YnhG family)